MTRRGVISERERFHAISLGPIKATRIECSISRARRISEVCGRKACSMITRATDRRYRVITGSIFRTTSVNLRVECGNDGDELSTIRLSIPVLHDHYTRVLRSAESPQSFDHHPVAVTPFLISNSALSHRNSDRHTMSTTRNKRAPICLTLTF